tara:strand:+ start:876 stop:1694 length:819 start_codon:yes stop_codon:yes gene_type:complete
MAQFYKELKDLRESRGISIEEIHNRTKISIAYIRAIESGDFDSIETPYLRLFLRAYAEEIGGDSKSALEQLDSFLGKTNPNIQGIQSQNEEHNDENENHNVEDYLLGITNQKLRQDLIKGAILLVIFIFAILIFKKIFSTQDSNLLSQDGQIFQKTLTSYELTTNFILDNSSEETIPTTPPFFIKVRSLNEITFTFQIDTLPPISSVIQANWEQDLEAFVNQSNLLFPNTKGLTLYINGVNLQNIKDYNHPLRLTIKPSPPSIVIQRYKPLG